MSADEEEELRQPAVVVEDQQPLQAFEEVEEEVEPVPVDPGEGQDMLGGC